jgi:TRAP-type C4-dicarboxylate transport system permease small subunit
MDRVLKWLEWPIHFFLWIALFAGFLMMLHVSADVTGRYFFGKPIEGPTEFVSAYYMVIVAYLPWAYLARNDTHISVDIFTRLMPVTIAHWLDIAVKVTVLLYLYVFISQTGSQAINQTRIHEVWQAGTTFIPVWPSRWLPPVAASLMALYLVVKIIDDIIKGPQQRPAHPVEEGA